MNPKTLEPAGKMAQASSLAAGAKNGMYPSWIKIFIASAWVILLMAALIRLIIAAGDAPALSLPDALLGMPLRYAVLVVGTVELVVAWVCLFGKSVGLSTVWLTWLGTVYLAFQAGLVWVHCQLQGTCLGSLTDPLHLARGDSGILVGLLPWYVVLGGFAVAATILFPRRAKASPQRNGRTQGSAKPGAPGSVPAAYVRFLKIACTACGGHIEFPTNLFGEQIPCPHCRAGVTLQKPVTLKMACPACAGRLEFPDHALGQKTPCPHCQREITLQKGEK